MMEPVLSVTFDLTDFPTKQATDFVARNYRSAWIRRCWFFGMFATQMSILMLFGEVGFDPAKSVPIFVLLIGLCVLIFASHANSKAHRKASDGWVMNFGTRAVSLDAAGLTYGSQFSQGIMPYSALKDVIVWRDAVLFIISGYAHLPIPSQAFSTDEARTAFLEVAKRHIAAAKKDKP